MAGVRWSLPRELQVGLCWMEGWRPTPLQRQVQRAEQGRSGDLDGHPRTWGFYLEVVGVTQQFQAMKTQTSSQIVTLQCLSSHLNCHRLQQGHDFPELHMDTQKVWWDLTGQSCSGAGWSSSQHCSKGL